MGELAAIDKVMLKEPENKNLDEIVYDMNEFLKGKEVTLESFRHRESEGWEVKSVVSLNGFQCQKVADLEARGGQDRISLWGKRYGAIDDLRVIRPDDGGIQYRWQTNEDESLMAAVLGWRDCSGKEHLWRLSAEQNWR